MNTAGLAGSVEANRQPATSETPKFLAIDRPKEKRSAWALLRFLTRPSEILKAQVIRRVLGKAFEIGAAREVIARISDENPRRLGHYDLLCLGHQLETRGLVVGACGVADQGVDLVVLIVAIVDE